MNFHCNRFNLRFNISNPKHRPNRQLSPLPGQKILPHSSLENIVEKSISPEVPEMHEIQSSTFYPRKHKISRMTDQPPQISQSTEMDYVRSGFPLRKKKTGEQQFLKLLLKFADNPNGSKKEGKPLFEHSSRDKFEKPKLKMRTTFHWSKQRYCINRDKDNGVFMDSFRNSATDHFKG